MKFFSILRKNRSEIEQIQLKKIKRVVSIAYEKSKFYHKFYDDNGFHPSMLRTYQDINSIPIVQRSLLRTTPVEEIVTNHDFANLHLHTTSGSSGIPIKFYYSNREAFLSDYGVLRTYLIMGMRLMDNTVALRDPIDIRKPTFYQHLGIIPYDYYNIYNPMSEIYNQLCDRYSKIDVLKGMPSDLLNLCYEIKKGNKKFPKVRVLISDSEVLDEFSRQFISEVIGKPVLDFYGSVENGCIAFQMQNSQKYFLNEDLVMLENGSADSVVGDAVITNLRNTTFPIIRYQIGDIIDFGDGKSDISNIHLKTIDGIQGKYLDFIVLPDKSIISPHIPKQELTHLIGIKKFQIIQREFDQVTIKIERDEEYSEQIEQDILSKLNQVFKNKIVCSIEYDDTLSNKITKKFKVIQSDVAQSFLSEI